MRRMLTEGRTAGAVAALILAVAAAASADAASTPLRGAGVGLVHRIDSNGDPVNGRKLFLENNCYICHGGRGGGGMCPSLRDRRPDANDVADAVLNGKPQGMPSFAALLSDLDVNDLAAYIHSLRSQNEPTFVEWWLPQGR